MLTLNGRKNRIFVRIVSLIMAQVFLCTSVLYPATNGRFYLSAYNKTCLGLIFNSNALRVPMEHGKFGVRRGRSPYTPVLNEEFLIVQELLEMKNPSAVWAYYNLLSKDERDVLTYRGLFKDRSPMTFNDIKENYRKDLSVGTLRNLAGSACRIIVETTNENFLSNWYFDAYDEKIKEVLFKANIYTKHDIIALWIKNNGGWPYIENMGDKEWAVVERTCEAQRIVLKDIDKAITLLIVDLGIKMSISSQRMALRAVSSLLETLPQESSIGRDLVKKGKNLFPDRYNEILFKAADKFGFKLPLKGYKDRNGLIIRDLTKGFIAKELESRIEIAKKIGSLFKENEENRDAYRGSIKYIIPILSDTDRIVRITIMNALDAFIGQKVGTGKEYILVAKALNKMLKDQDAEIRLKAAIMLDRMENLQMGHRTGYNTRIRRILQYSRALRRQI